MAVVGLGVHALEGVANCAQADMFVIDNVMLTMVLINAEFCWMNSPIAVFFCTAAFDRLLREPVVVFAC